MAIVGAVLLGGCSVFVDDSKAPVRPDLARAQGALGIDCESGVKRPSARAWERAMAGGQPLLERYRLHPDRPFRYFGDEPETTARQEVEKLLSWMRRDCPDVARRLRRDLAG